MDLLAKLRQRHAYHNGACIALTGVIADLEAELDAQLEDQRQLVKARGIVQAAMMRAIEEAPFADQVTVRE